MNVSGFRPAPHGVEHFDQWCVAGRMPCYNRKSDRVDGRPLHSFSCSLTETGITYRPKRPYDAPATEIRLFGILIGDPARLAPSAPATSYSTTPNGAGE